MINDNDVRKQLPEQQGDMKADIEPSKADLLARLKSLNVARAEVLYEGYGDEGYVGGLWFYDNNNQEIQLSHEDMIFVDGFVSSCLEAYRVGWEIDEGSCGVANINV